MATVRKHTNSGQALVEFALTLPVLVFLVMGLIDFGIILFSYSHASNSLRDALRKAEVLGYVQGGDTAPYLKCSALQTEMQKGWFSTTQSATVTYVDSANTSTVRTCAAVEANPTLVENGDMLHMKLVAKVKPMFLRFGELTFTFEGERTITRTVKAIPNSGGEGTGHIDPSVTKPPSPTSFLATSHCDTGHVEFSWYWGTTNPMPTRAEIRDMDTGNVVVTITDTTQTSCTGDCYVSIGSPEIRKFYIVAYNGSGASQKASDPSLYSLVNCPAPVPPAPENFDASVNCSTGEVSFTYDWPGSAAAPSRREIYDADTDTVVANCTGSVCYDMLPIPGSRTYYMKAYYGSNYAGGTLETGGPNSNETYVECPAVGNLVVRLARENTGTSLCYYASYYASQSITISLNGVALPAKTTDSNGIVTFSNVPIGTYTVTIPSSQGTGSSKRTPRTVWDAATTCAVSTTASYSSSYTTVKTNQTSNVVFGYAR